MYDAMIWTGTALTLLGVGILAWCILRAAGIRRAKLPDEELRAALMALLPINLGALLLSAIGLMLVVLGVILG